jgi:hypothetical protein
MVMLRLRYHRSFSMYFLRKIQIHTLINSHNAEASLFTFCKSSIKNYLKGIKFYISLHIIIFHSAPTKRELSKC